MASKFSRPQFFELLFLETPIVYAAGNPDEAILHRHLMVGCETIRRHLGVFEMVRLSMIQQVHVC